jgi:peptidoglycan/LPS O-acetylase OafA/YrhL
MLIEVFGADKLYYHKGATGTAFLIGEIAPEHLAQGIIAPWKPSVEQAPPLTTDDWPYLYMRARKIPSAYWQAVLLISVACLVLFARTFPQALRPNWHFWLLGAAFLLVEFKSITEFALLFGTTWLVNALAITGVLAMSLAANLIVLWRKRIRVWVAYVLLFASLALAYLIPLELLVGLPLSVRLVASILLLSLPLFFAGLIFSESLRRTGEAAQALASNLNGSFVGGILEYGSLVWGIKSLYVIAAVVYLGALITSRIRSD